MVIRARADAASTSRGRSPASALFGALIADDGHFLAGMQAALLVSTGVFVIAGAATIRFIGPPSAC